MNAVTPGPSSTSLTRPPEDVPSGPWSSATWSWSTTLVNATYRASTEPSPSAAGSTPIDVGWGIVAPVNTARPAVGSLRGDADAVTAAHDSASVRMRGTIIARNVSPR